MKKKLLFNFTKFLSQKTTFRMAAFAVLMLLTAQSSFAQQWPILGNESAISNVTTSYTNIAVVPDGASFTPYVVYVETLTAGVSSSGTPATGLAKVKKRQADGTWVQVGANLAATGASYTRIYADATGNLYVTYIDGAVSSKLAVRKYNSVSGNWDPLKNDANNLYASTVSATHNLKNFFTTARSSMAFDSQGTPYIAFCGGAPFAPIVKKFDGNSWVLVGSGASVSADIALSPSLTIDNNDKPWLAFTAVTTFVSGTTSTGQLKLYTITDTSTSGSWTVISVPATIPESTAIGSTTSMRDLSLTFVKGTGNTLSGQLAIVHYNTANGSKATVISFDRNSTWGFLGTVSTGGCPNLNLTSDYLGSLYCSYVDNYNASYLARSRVFKLDASVTTAAWTELTEQSAIVNGIDEPTGSVSLALGYNSATPYVVYTKKNSSNVETAIVRKYNSLAPSISAFIPKPPVAGEAFTITGTNFTNVLAVTFGGIDAASYAVVSPTSITGIIGGSVTNTTVSVTTTDGLAIASTPSALSYASVSSTYNGLALFPTVTTTSNLIYSVSPALPAGLSINTGNGTISGSTTAIVASATFTITAANKYGNTTTTVTFATGVTPSALSYGTVPSGYVTGTAMSLPVTAITLGTDTSATYTVSPSLPAGLVLSSSTGGISGAPTAVAVSTAYVVTATTIYGFTTKTITFATGVAPSAFSYTPAASASYAVGTAITPLVTVITPGTGTPVYTVSPALPAGLVLSSSTGGISGTPTAEIASASYTVTATTVYGSTTNVITFATGIVPLSNDSFEKLDVVRVYPNPTTDVVTVALSNAAVIEKIAVYNSLGQLVLSEAKNTVSLQNLANGNYYLTIYTAEGNYSKKIIKQ